MRKFFILCVLMVMGLFMVMAQSPEKFTYQAVVRNANNQLVANTLVGVRVSILQGSATGTPVYVETHSANTNANGLLTVEIGGGSVQQGAFADINWANGPYFLKTETDPNGGTSYSVVSTQQLLSVPYALYSKEAGNGFSGDYNDLTNTPAIPTVPANVSAFTNDAGYITGYTETDPQYNAWDKDYNDLINRPNIPTVPTNVSAFTNDAGYITSADIPDIPTVPTNVSAFVNDVPYMTSFTEQQELSISNDTIFLTGGSFVKLPDATDGFSGDYNDLTNQPVIPTVPENVSAFNNDAGYITGYTETDPQYNAWNKDYNDLINKPTIPTVPTNVSAFNNDANYITSADIPEIPTVPTNVSAFVNDVPYLTSFTEQQVLSISNDTIFLTGGSFVKLPAGFSGDYNDLTNKPDIPEIPDIPTVPDSVSAFTNDAGYITMADLQALLEELNALNNRVDSLENLVNNQTPVTQDTVDAQPCPGTPTVTDIDGNVYNTVQIGQQCWMKENLRARHYADVTDVPDIRMPRSDESFIPEYGYLYNWSAVMNGAASSITAPSGVQGICPDGWHLPSETEWTRLTDYVGSQSAYICGGNSNNIAKALASASGWESSDGTCSVGNAPWTNNATGFNAMPMGYVRNGTVRYSGEMASFYTSTEMTQKLISVYDPNMLNSDYSGIYASVRCVLGDASDTSNVFIPTVPEVETDSVTGITAKRAVVGCRILSNGGANIVASGILWGESSDLTYDENDWSHTVYNYDGVSHFVDYVSGLDYEKTYYVRAFAVNMIGVAYGSVISFTSASYEHACPDMTKVADVDGNVYNTIQVGSQCWMKENLKTRHYANGTAIDTMPVSSSSYYDDYSDKYYGDMARGTKKITDVNSVLLLQGACPDGWHLPTIAEWNTFMDNNTFGTGSNSDFGSDCSFWTGVGNYSYNICEGTYDSYYYSYTISSWDGNIQPVRCVRGEGVKFPSVHLDSISGITMTTANYSAEVLSGNGLDVTDRGICWATTTKPTTSNNTVSHHAGLNNVGAFAGTIGNSWSQLSPGATYYVRAYATNYLGTTYSNEIMFTTLTEMPDTPTDSVQLPTVITGPSGSGETVYDITSTSATSGYVVTDNGGVEITDQGLCWSTFPHPTLDDNYVSGSNYLTNLDSCTTYYVRAYAINSVGVAYGNEVTFNTLCDNPMFGDGQPCPDAPTLTDVDNNTYNTLKIGNQCWMKENLRTTHYADGTAIPADAASWSYESEASASRFAPNDDETIVSTYGYLYNWNAVMNGANSTDANPSVVQGICPAGWHVPSDAEWAQLTDYILAQSAYVCGDSSVAKALADTLGWQASETVCSPGNNLLTNNTTGFSMRPAGEWRNNSRYFGQYAEFWTATENEENERSAVAREFTNDISSFYASPYFPKNDGYSVRCVKGQGANIPTVTTGSVGQIKDTTAFGTGQVVSDGGSPILQSGVCVSSAHVPTIADHRESMGAFNGMFGALIEGLTPGTTYYMRAYAINAVGTAYGEVVSFTTLSDSTVSYASCQGTPIVSDYEGNFYNTVQIGDQCWMRENLRSTKYANGQSISGCIAPNGDASLVEQYGYLYYWSTVMNGAGSSNAYPSGVQGVCPDGWHVPSKMEWEKLIAFVGNQADNVCGDNSSNIAKALASKTGWFNDFSECTVGNNPSLNNTTGFSSLPAGGTGSNLAGGACFWTCSLSPSTYNGQMPWYYSLTYDNAAIALSYTNYYSILSVRCLKTEAAVAPSVSTLSVTTNSDSLTVTVTGEVTSDGHADVSRGVCWATAPNPTLIPATNSPYIHGVGQSAGTGVGVFSVNLPGLQSGHTYYVRAYAYNSSDTVYGEQLTVTPTFNSMGASCPESNRVIDKSGNVYRTVQIGNQCWMKQNLRTTRYANGNQISSSNWWYPNGDESNKAGYGLLYSWSAVMNGTSSSSANPSGVQGICPSGWHVPSKGEWQQLSDYVSASGSTPDQLGFALVNAGSYGRNNSSYSGFDEANQCYYWSSTESSNYYYSSDNAYYYYTSALSTSGFSTSTASKSGVGFSVRCVLNQTDMNPTVTTAAATDRNYTSATMNASVSNPYNLTITDKGFEWKSSSSDYEAVSVTGEGFHYTLTGLAASTSYTYRAYVTTVLGTVYGEEVTFTTYYSNSCSGTPVVTDIDGNTYNTVIIGTQCWMRENLAVTRYSNGQAIPLGTESSTSVAYRYRPYNDATFVPVFGYLYNYKAIMHGAENTSDGTAIIQGICPTGWHLPRYSDFYSLTYYLSQYEDYICGYSNSNIAKALADKTWWSHYNDFPCSVGTNPLNNNSSGFSALPAGYYSSSGYATNEYGYQNAHFYGTGASVMSIFAPQTEVSLTNYGNSIWSEAYSVRCLKD